MRLKIFNSAIKKEIYMKKKLLNKKTIPILATLGIVIVAGLIKIMADRQSRVAY